jgi:hypothetical protein
LLPSAIAGRNSYRFKNLPQKAKRMRERIIIPHEDRSHVTVASDIADYLSAGFFHKVNAVMLPRLRRRRFQCPRALARPGIIH